MKHKKLIGAVLLVVTGITGIALAQERLDRSGPNVMPAPGADARAAPRGPAAAPQAKGGNAGSPEVRSGPNIIGEPSVTAPNPATGGGRQPAGVSPGCERCVAI